MKNTTITIWVKVSSLNYFLKTFDTISILPNDWTDTSFKKHDLVYFTENMVGNYIQLNIPVIDFVRFDYNVKNNLK